MNYVSLILMLINCFVFYNEMVRLMTIELYEPNDHTL